MLKFLRKYNVLILVIGGSLLMVVFLLQPVLTRLQPSPEERKIGTIGADKSKVAQRDLHEASDDIRILEALSPFIVRAGLQLDQGHEMHHYFLLLYEAKREGLVGGVDDGASLIPQLARDQAQLEELSKYPQQYWGLIRSQPFFAQDVAKKAVELEPQLMQARELIAQRWGMPVDRVDQALANTRGILRLRNTYNAALRFSAPDALVIARDRFDAALADVLVVPSTLFVSEIPTPTEDQLLAHFEQYKSDPPGTGEFGFGYLQPPSVKLEWLVLDPAVFSTAVTPDPIEVRKRWSQNREKYKGEFADERAGIESEIRANKAQDLLADADQIIRQDVLARTRPLATDDQGFLILPDDWDQRRPRMADIAQQIVNDLSQREHVTLPMPLVEVRNSQWLSAQDMSQLPALSRAAFRVGATPMPTPYLPSLVRENQTGQRSPLHAQVGVPIVETPAVDQSGRRYYVTVLAARPQSPPDSLDDVREEVTTDLTAKLAYDKLISEAPRYEELAREEGLDAVASLVSQGKDPDSAPKVDQSVLLTRAGASPVLEANLKDARVRTATEFLEAAVDAAAERLDPHAPIAASPLAESIVSGASPRDRILVLGRLTAYRPVTIEDYRLRSRGLLRAEAADLLAESTHDDDPDPFSYDALVTRTNFILKSKGDDDEEGAGTPSGDTTPPAPVQG
ncbi:MAG: hypothetical protein R3B57_08085 [Phycisphaerales bacterium]